MPVDAARAYHPFNVLLDWRQDTNNITPQKGGLMPCAKRGVKKTAKKTAKKKKK
ncbi:MAG: hypothetical protein ABIK86_05875 [candidate division WOR-3 bacterium]